MTPEIASAMGLEGMPMSQALRGKEAALAAAGSGDPALGRWGQAWQQQQGQEAQQLLREAQAEQWKQEQKIREDKASEDVRHHKAMEARPPPAFFYPGAEGLVAVDPRNPTAPAMPVRDQSGQIVKKEKPTRVISDSEKTSIESIRSEAEGAAKLANAFQPEFAGFGIAGGAPVDVANLFGSMAPEKYQKLTQFWADFNRLVDLPQRNAVFGASLSTGEKASWEGAKNIKPGVDPKVIQAKLAELTEIANRKMKGRRESMLAEGYEPAAVNALLPGDIATTTMPSGGGGAGDPKIARIAELKAQGKTPEQILQTLKSEGLHK
jgi:hypothetical protein